MSFLKWIGISGTDKKGSDAANEWLNQTGEERFYGFENYGNTCYCNSVLQALYYCQPFRDCVTEYTPLMLGSAAARAALPSPATANPANVAGGSKAMAFDFKRDKRKDAPAVPAGPSIKSAQEARSEKELLEYLDAEETLLATLKDLFLKIASQKKRTGVMGPQQFVAKLRKESEQFRSNMHQDAHEFFNYTLNTIGETLTKQQKEVRRLQQSAMNGIGGHQSADHAGGDHEDGGKPGKDDANNTWIHKLFEGQLVNETRCLTCETVSSRDEPFLDLSIDVEQHASLSACLRNFSTSETLCSKNKFFCDKCCSLQEAEKRMKIKKLPNILAIHLKRFKYQEKLQRYTKLAYRVVFPLELRVFNTSDDAENPDRLYNLFAIIVHIGSGPYHGHYVTLIKTHDQWVLFDDDTVEPVDEAYLQRYFGDINQSGSGYIFFYSAADFDSSAMLKAMGSGTPQKDTHGGRVSPNEAAVRGPSTDGTSTNPALATATPIVGRTSLAAEVPSAPQAVAPVANGSALAPLEKVVAAQPAVSPVMPQTPVSGGAGVSPSAASLHDAAGKKKGRRNGEDSADHSSGGAFGWLPFGKKKSKE